MADRTSFDKLLKGSNYTIRKLADESVGWFRQEVARTRKLAFNRRKFLTDDAKFVAKRIEIGKLYMYQYSPKYMDTLPIWDEFPLVLPFSPTNNGFIGINLHYLPYRHRAWLLDRLLKTASLKNNRLRVSWEILSGISRVDVGEMATHRYIANNIVSPMRMIPIDDYAKAIMLPIQKWHGEDKNQMANFV